MRNTSAALDRGMSYQRLSSNGSSQRQVAVIAGDAPRLNAAATAWNTLKSRERSMDQRKHITVLVGRHTLLALARGEEVHLNDVDASAVVTLIPESFFPSKAILAALEPGIPMEQVIVEERGQGQGACRSAPPPAWPNSGK
jgi:hypothetical protein